MRRLIINADDFGYNRDINAGIVQANRAGVLTATTLMATGAAFDDAVRLAKETPSLDIGAHLVLVQGCSLLDGKPFPATPTHLLAVLAGRGFDIYAELKAQIEKILAAGLRPSHLDSHKHTHLVPAVFRTVVRLADEFRIPWVRLPPCGFAHRYYRRLARHNNVQLPDHFLGFRLTGFLTEKTFAKALQHLPAGTSEFMCHPGYLGDELKQSRSRLKESRLLELEALTSPRIRELIAGLRIQLSRFP